MSHEVVSSHGEALSTPEGRIKQEIDKFLEGSDMQSPLSQAFFDFVDVRDAYTRDARQLASNHTLVTSRPLIEEDIRKKKNTVPSYNKAYKEVTKKLETLQKAENFKAEFRGGLNENFLDILHKIKDEVLDEKGQESTQPKQ